MLEGVPEGQKLILDLLRGKKAARELAGMSDVKLLKRRETGIMGEALPRILLIYIFTVVTGLAISSIVKEHI